MLKRANKRGQDLSIGTLILIVLGIIVLVLLILGFSMGWDNLWRKIGIYKGGSSISDVATACQLAATSSDKYTYCNDFKQIKDDQGNIEYVSCMDSRLQNSIDKKLDCQDNDQIEAKYCVQLKTSQGTNFKPETKVNGKACTGCSKDNIALCSQEQCDSNVLSGKEVTYYEGVCRTKIDAGILDFEKKCKTVPDAGTVHIVSTCPSVKKEKTVTLDTGLTTPTDRKCCTP